MEVWFKWDLDGSGPLLLLGWLYNCIFKNMRPVGCTVPPVRQTHIWTHGRAFRCFINGIRPRDLSRDLVHLEKSSGGNSDSLCPRPWGQPAVDVDPRRLLVHP